MKILKSDTLIAKSQHSVPIWGALQFSFAGEPWISNPPPNCCGKSNTYRLWHLITNNIIERHHQVKMLMWSQTCNAPQKSPTWSLIDCTRVKWESNYFKVVWNAITKIYCQLSSFVTKDVTEQTVLNIVYTCTNKDAQEDL